MQTGNGSPAEGKGEDVVNNPEKRPIGGIQVSRSASFVPCIVVNGRWFYFAAYF